MNKVFILILICLFAKVSIAQNNTYEGNANTMTNFASSGAPTAYGLTKSYVVNAGIFSDTTTANVVNYLKNYNGAQIMTYSGGVKWWLRYGGSWNQISGSASSGWGLTGNAGTNPATNFLGTTDSVRLDLRTNNTIRQSITGSGNVGIGITNPSATLHIYTDNASYDKLGDNAQEFVADDSILISSTKLKLNVNNVLSISGIPSGVGTKALRINPSTGIVTYADTTAGGGGGVSGSGTANQMAYWNGTSSLTGNTFQTTDGYKFTSGKLLITDTTTGATPNASVKVYRTLANGFNGHAFRDETTYTPTTDGLAYASFDAASEITNNKQHDHIAAYQSRIGFASVGHLNDFYGGVTQNYMSNGTMSRSYGWDVWNPTTSAGGTIDTSYGFHVQALTSGTKNYPFASEGTASSYMLGGLSLGQKNADSTLTIIGSIRATGNIKFSGLPTTGTVYKTLRITPNGTVIATDTAASGGSGWALTGNASTDSTINFLGTTDNKPLILKVNNFRSGFIGSGVSGSSQNTGFGYKALNAPTGNFNTAFGFNALTANTSGTYNVGIGWSALAANTTASNSIAIGEEALAQSNAADNIAIGTLSLYGNTSGSQNVGIGTRALLTNSTGLNNTAVGYYALNKTTASNSTALGSEALRNATGANNSAFGSSAGYAITSGINNTAFGYSALSSSTTTSNNTAIGHQAGFGVTGTGNLLIGVASIAASYNQVTSGSNNISIGTNVAVASATASNQLCIGNFIYGTGLDGTGSTISGGKIGIGITAPTSTLHTAGSFATAYVAKTANYTATVNDQTIDFTSGTDTLTLPTAVGITGRIYTITNSGTLDGMIYTTSSQTFTNYPATPSTLALPAKSTRVVQSTGANWVLVSVFN